MEILWMELLIAFYLVAMSHDDHNCVLYTYIEWRYQTEEWWEKSEQLSNDEYINSWAIQIEVFCEQNEEQSTVEENNPRPIDVKCLPNKMN